MKKYCVAIALIFIAISAPVRAQHISGAMQFSNPVAEADSNTFSVAYSTMNFFRDYEYFKNKIQTGETFFGGWHYPRLVVQPSKNLKLEGGVLIQQLFGEKVTQKPELHFSIQYQLKNLRLIFGTLESNLTHGYLEPLMGIDRSIQRPLEEGFQLKYNSKRIESDLWLDWMVRQTENSDYPEELTGGFTFKWRLTEPGKPWQVKLPVQLIAPHKGGQLDTNHTTVSTIVNEAIGLSSAWTNPNKKAFSKEFKAEAYFLGYTHFNANTELPYENGHGVMVSAMLRSKYDISLQATYWNGTKYISGWGAPLYQSVSHISGVPANYAERSRQLLMLNLMFDKEILPHFYIDARLSPYIDLKQGFLEQSYLIFMSYKNTFRIARIKK